MRVLLSGFHPQWGWTRSPSHDLAKIWQDKLVSVEGVEVKSIILPQIFDQDGSIICNEIGSFKPNVILMVGVTPKNDPLRLEKFAVNAIDTPMGDNSRIAVKNRTIVLNGPPAYESTLPIDFLANHLNEAQIHTVVSFHAGTQACNHVMYQALHWLANNEMPHHVMAGFVHTSIPNSYGIVSDHHYPTATFEEIVKTSVILVKQCTNFYRENYGS